MSKSGAHYKAVPRLRPWDEKAPLFCESGAFREWGAKAYGTVAMACMAEKPGLKVSVAFQFALVKVPER